MRIRPDVDVAFNGISGENLLSLLAARYFMWEADAPEPKTPISEAAEPGLADDGRTARLDELQARADEAAYRIDAQRADLDASSKHTAQMERETQAEPEAGRQAETSYEMDNIAEGYSEALSQLTVPDGPRDAL